MALAFSTPATAASCWSTTSVSAAQVRELQAMMMAMALRCAAHGVPIHDSYNGFVRANMDALNAASATLRVHFGEANNGSGQDAYDRYTTELSNRYGSGHTSSSSCAAFSEIGARAAASATNGGLATFAAEIVPQPHSIGTACPVTAGSQLAQAGR